jgi:hypothetical protein
MSGTSKTMKRAVALGAIGALLATGCPSGPKLPPTPDRKGKTPGASGGDPCAGLAREPCERANAMVGAAGGFSNVKHDYILDPTSSFAPGRGLQKTSSGLWDAVPTACATPHRQTTQGSAVDAQQIDFGFVGVAVDSTLVGADVDLTPYFSAGGSASVHKIKLLAIAFARDLDPQFFDASEEVAFQGAACACARATHFVGAVKMGGMLAYETEVRAGEVHGRALEFMKAKLAASDATVTETRVGGLEIEGLEAAMRGGPSGGPSATALTFKVRTPVPIAYSVYPISDVCKFALPAPEVTPIPVDFGDVPYGREGTRMLHIVNRASIDLSISFRGKLFEVAARGSADVPSRWMPEGDALGCEAQTREDTLVFSALDSAVPVVPKQQTVRVIEQVRAGRGVVLKREAVDSGERKTPDYKATNRELECPRDYVVESCKAVNTDCGDDGCAKGGYAISSTQTANGCRFGCTGPTSMLIGTHYCRFDAVAECRLKCGK